MAAAILMEEGRHMEAGGLAAVEHWSKSQGGLAEV